jgi:ankyrin repeat protein
VEPSTDLRKACLSEDATKLRTLLAGGADVNAKDKLGETPLFHVIGGGHDGIVAHLLEKRANPSLPGAARRHCANLPGPAWGPNRPSPCC